MPALAVVQGAVVSQWRGPRGFGARHINDDVPFSLWNEVKQDFRSATTQEMVNIIERYDAERIECYGILILIETANPPRPVPLTVACTAAIFVSPSDRRRDLLIGSSLCVGPRIQHPFPNLGWGKMQTPRKSQMLALISALRGLANVQRVNFLPDCIIVELVYGDGRVYPNRSLPARLAGLVTTYHHDPAPFFSSIGYQVREDSMGHGQFSQAGPTKELAQSGDLVRGTWFEVNREIPLQYLIDSFERPVQLPEQPETPPSQWKHSHLFRIFGSRTPEMIDGLRGAPIVEADTGRVAGFFQLANSDWAECMALDGLVAEEGGGGGVLP